LRKAVWTLITVLLLLSITASRAFADQDSEWSGVWDVIVSFDTGSSAGVMTLDAIDGTLTGTSQPLDENGFFPLDVNGSIEGQNARIDLLFHGDVAGSLTLSLESDMFSGEGELYGVPVKVLATTGTRPHRAPMTHDLMPDSYTTQFTGNAPPILRLVPGDIVRTTTLDNEGRDSDLKWQGMPGNTLTGPFFIEGAKPGDTLVIHLIKIEINRDTAKMYSGSLNQKAVQSGYVQAPQSDWGRVWSLDKKRGAARPKNPSDKLAKFVLPITPMIGSIGVAPPLNQSIYAGDLGFHGGNLDYNRFIEGATIYLPIWRSGAYFFLGDGHALQGDGEISGQGLETSLDVEFKVDLIKGETFRQIWSENSEYIMFSGIDNSLDSSFQMATTGLARWLKINYGLNDSEVATVLSVAVEYDIAEVVDPRPHVVAKIKKSTLKMLKK